MNGKARLMLAAAGAGIFLGFGVSPAEATADRTWVSHAGSDANPCTEAAPCATFQQAYSQTNQRGEIVCTDVGSYGPVTINHSITIDCRSAPSIIDTPTFGVDIIGSGADDVRLMGLTIRSWALNGRGINADHIARLTVRDTTIVATGVGIAFVPVSVSAQLLVSNTKIDDAAYGVDLEPGPTNQDMKALLDHVQVRNAAQIGINVGCQGASGFELVTIVDSQVTESGTGIQAALLASTQRGLANVVRSEINYNTVGLKAYGSNAQIRARDSTITGNGTGLLPSTGGVIVSYGNNALYGSVTADGTFSATLPRQ